MSELRELLAKATAGRLDTAERRSEEWIECPVCQGEGEVHSVDYCNIDGKALGVQFYGIGEEHLVHEKLWIAAVNALPALLAELDGLRAEVERLRPYTQHHLGCAVRFVPIKGEARQCDCGLTSHA